MRPAGRSSTSSATRRGRPAPSRRTTTGGWARSRPRTTRTTSSRPTTTSRPNEGESAEIGLDQAPDPGHRDRDPAGPVVELVAQLVDRLLELEDRQQLPRGPRARRQQRRVGVLEVALEEGVARPVL